MNLKTQIWETDPQKRWERDTRQWWAYLAVSLIPILTVVLAAPFLPFPWDWVLGTIACLFGVLTAFQAGFFYNDRMRQLGKSKGFLPKLRRPPS